MVENKTNGMEEMLTIISEYRENGQRLKYVEQRTANTDNKLNRKSIWICNKRNFLSIKPKP